MKRYLVFVLILALVVAAIPATADGGSLITMTLTTGSFNVSAARGMLSMVNRLRTGNDAWCWDSTDTEKVYVSGLDALNYDYGLERVAMLRAAELAILYSHTRPNGELCFSAYPSAFLYGHIGENIAYGYVSNESVFTAWAEENEPYSGQGHRRNMLSSDFTSIGIGCFSSNGVLFWVQEFSSVTSGASEDPLTIPLKVTALDGNLSKFGTKFKSVLLKPGENQGLSDVLTVCGTGYNSNNPIGCRIDDILWTSDNASIASLSGDSVVGKGDGKTALTCAIGTFSVSLPVRVNSNAGSFTAEIGGSQILSGSYSNNLSLSLPGMENVVSYQVTVRKQESGYVTRRSFNQSGTYGMRVSKDDDHHPVHCQITVDALDSDGDIYDRYTENVVLYPSTGVLWLPKGLEEIGSEAFMGSDAYCAVLPKGCVSIGEKAFSSSANLCAVYIPSTVTSIAEDAFAGCNDALLIAVPKGSNTASLVQSLGYSCFEVK